MKNLSAKKLGVVLSAIALLFASSASLGGPKGAQRIEGGFDWPEEGFYFSCLNDYLSGTVFYELLSHVVETPSGNVHIVTGFFGIGHIYSLTTGETWTQKFAFPGTETIKLGEGQTAFWLGREKFIPDDPHGTVFFIEQWYKLTVNANGELVVYRDSWTPDIDFPSDVSRCAGKGKKQ